MFFKAYDEKGRFVCIFKSSCEDWETEIEQRTGGNVVECSSDGRECSLKTDNNWKLEVSTR